MKAKKLNSLADLIETQLEKKLKPYFEVLEEANSLRYPMAIWRELSKKASSELTTKEVKFKNNLEKDLNNFLRKLCN